MMKKILLLIAALSFFCSCASPGPKKIATILADKQDADTRQKVDKMVKSEEIMEKDGRKFKTYVVKPGDSLWSIAASEFQKGILWKKIAEDNKISEPYYLRLGREILIGLDLSLGNQEQGDKPFVYRVLSNKAFGVGEKLVFAVKYFGVTAGIGILEIKGVEIVNGRKTYVITATARTAPFFEGLYYVRDVITSNMDAMGLFSMKYSKKLEEGKYRNESYMEFDHKEGIATKKDGKKYKVPAFVQDVLSEFYYYRVVFTGKEKEIYIDTAADDGKSHSVRVETIGEEKITVDAGEFDTWHIRPFLKFEGIFRQKGDVDIWLSKDGNKIPVLVKSKILIGTIDAVLQEAVVVKAE